MELYYVISIVNRKISQELLKIHGSLRLTVVTASLGRGTATSEHLSLHDLEPSEKAVVCAIAGRESLNELIKAAKRRLYIDIPGNGIIAAIPIKSVAGGDALACMTDGQIIGGAIPEMNFKHELIVVILNEGYSDNVMDAARNAGATGGTVLHAKGTGSAQSDTFFHVSLAEEKDMVYILSSTGKKSAIMKAINRDCGIETPVGAICFSLPASEVVGIRRLDDE